MNDAPKTYEDGYEDGVAAERYAQELMPRTRTDPSRAEIAMAAMQGMLFGCVGNIGTSTEVSAYAKGHCNSAIAERAVAMADALIAALEKPR
jgi:hypothetical protein